MDVAASVIFGKKQADRRRSHPQTLLTGPNLLISVRTLLAPHLVPREWTPLC